MLGNKRHTLRSQIHGASIECRATGAILRCGESDQSRCGGEEQTSSEHSDFLPVGAVLYCLKCTMEMQMFAIDAENDVDLERRGWTLGEITN